MWIQSLAKSLWAWAFSSTKWEKQLGLPYQISVKCSRRIIIILLCIWFFRVLFLISFCLTLESPLDSKDIKPVNPKGNQSWIFIGRTDAEANAKKWLIRKRLWCWERLKVGGEGDDRGWDGWLDGIMSLSKFRELVIDREAWHATVHRVEKSWTWLSDWTECQF